MAPTIGWNENAPAGGDSLGLGDNEIRSLKTALRQGLDGEHVWPSGGGDAGVHRLGSGRAYYGPQSLVSSVGTDGRLMQASDTSQFFGVGSGGTSFIGGPTVISAGSFPGSVPQRAIWVEEFGEGQVKTTSATTTIAFPNSGYSGRPYVWMTVFDDNIVSAANDGLLGRVESVTATSAVLSIRSGSGAPGSNTSFFWRSIGTRTL